MTWVETETLIELQSRTVAIEVYLLFERAVSLPVNNLFPFPLATAKLIGDVWMNRRSGVKMFHSVITAPLELAQVIDFLIRRCSVNRIVILQIRSATPIQDMNASSPIYKKVK